MGVNRWRKVGGVSFSNGGVWLKVWAMEAARRRDDVGS